MVTSCTVVIPDYSAAGMVGETLRSVIQNVDMALL